MEQIIKETPQQRYKRLNPEKVKASIDKYRRSSVGKRKGANQHLLSSYGISLEQRDKKAAEQNQLCAACHQPWAKTPCVDHDHRCCPSRKSCGKCLRDLLCRRCNYALGLVADDPSVLLALRDYLVKWGVS